LIEPPTLINLGFEWFIEGDDNRNAVVEVSYRKQGDTGWSSALPLLRLHGERILTEQSDPRAEHAIRPSRAASESVRNHDVHALHFVGLQRLRLRSQHPDAVSMGESAVRRGRRLPGSESHLGGVGGRSCRTALRASRLAEEFWPRPFKPALDLPIMPCPTCTRTGGHRPTNEMWLMF
jgi:hypothetical protein